MGKKKVRRQKIMYEMKYHQANGLSFIQVTKQILIKYLLCIKHYARWQGYKGVKTDNMVPMFTVSSLYKGINLDQIILWLSTLKTNYYQCCMKVFNIGTCFRARVQGRLQGE